MRGTVLCDLCRRDVPWLGLEICPGCASPSRQARICRICDARAWALDGIRAACRFEGIARTAVHDLKYRRLRDRARLLGELAAEAIERRSLALDLLVPVPLAAARQRQRGFNQSELIARRLSEQIGVPMDVTALRRIRETPPQVGRSAADRRLNVSGAFECVEPGAVAGRRVALVDDVMTTGATLDACAEVLKRHGAARVYGVVVARD
jgi:ComF family protein